MGCNNCYDCLPLVTTPKGDTGATGSTGSTGPSGLNGFATVYATVATVSTGTTMTWETLGSYLLNSNSTTGLLAQDGDGYQVDAMFWMQSSGGSNGRQIRFNIGGVAAVAYTASSNEYLRLTLSLVRASSTSVRCMATVLTSFATYPKIQYLDVTVPSLDSNTLTFLLEGYNNTADAANKVDLVLSTVNFMNKS